MYCSKCGEKLSTPNQNFCPNCGNEIIHQPKTPTYKTQTPTYNSPQNEPQPIYYVPVKRQNQIQKGLPGKYSKLCLGMALASIFIGFASLALGYYSAMFMYYPYYNITRRIVVMIAILGFRVGGLILGIFSKVNSSKAELHEPYNDMEKAGSIIGILAIIINALGLFLLFVGPYSLLYYRPYY